MSLEKLLTVEGGEKLQTIHCQHCHQTLSSHKDEQGLHLLRTRKDQKTKFERVTGLSPPAQGVGGYLASIWVYVSRWEVETLTLFRTEKIIT